MTDVSSPIQIGGLAEWEQVISGQTLAIKTDGTMWTWGDSNSVRLGEEKSKEQKEKEIRDKNPFVQDLYEQYQVALILAGGEDL